jgi:hypothetical protein
MSGQDKVPGNYFSSIIDATGNFFLIETHFATKLPGLHHLFYFPILMQRFYPLFCIRFTRFRIIFILY